MSRASDIIVLCEDRLQEVFVRRFLKQGWGIKQPPIRPVPYPHGGSGGAGEKHVRDNYPNQLKAYRDRSAKAKTILIVVMDADVDTVQSSLAIFAVSRWLKTADFSISVHVQVACWKQEKRGTA